MATCLTHDDPGSLAHRLTGSKSKHPDPDTQPASQPASGPDLSHSYTALPSARMDSAKATMAVTARARSGMIVCSDVSRGEGVVVATYLPT